jgi:two-component system response regulator BaeR
MKVAEIKTMKKKILIVEDEQRLADLHRDYLRQTEYATEWLGDGNLVVPWVKDNKPDLILLDLMLPNKDGLEICKEIRTFSNVPIIMVTARVEEIDRLIGLELGADDYICKPFSPREVVARVKAVLRRGLQPAQGDELLVLDENCYLATLQGKALDLTAVEFQLLSILAGRPGQIFSRDQLMDRIYNDQRIVCDRTIDSHIKKLRKKIAAVTPEFELIQSVYGVGYRYKNP